MEWVGGSSTVKDWDRFRARVNETEIAKPNYVGKEGERTPTYKIVIWFGEERN